MEIVKVQLPIVSSDPTTPVLIYARGRQRMWQGVDNEVRDLLVEEGFVKAFMYGEWDKHRKKWRIDMERGFAPYQEW